MKIYKVGGFVRDKILNKKPTDTDYVVVGGSIQKMLQLGFIPVGKHFPVFLHPKTGEEYALARCEQKTGWGYSGFQFDVSSDITLVDDLSRRDITINAIAEDEYGNLIDPFNGIEDIKNKIIRHVSKAFVEDPLRVIRVARFSSVLNFKIAPETIDLMKEIVERGELISLPKERIKNELNKVIKFNSVYNFIVILEQVGALNFILPEFASIFNNGYLGQFESVLNIIYSEKPVIEDEVMIENNLLLIYFYIIQLDLENTPRSEKVFLNFFQLQSFSHMNKNNKEILLSKSRLKIIEDSLLKNANKTLLKLMFNFYDKINKNNFSNDINLIYQLIVAVDPIRQKHRYKAFTNLIKMIALIERQLCGLNFDNNNLSYKADQVLILIDNIVSKFLKINYTDLLKDLTRQQLIKKIKQVKYEIIQNEVFKLT